jgi:hypothetical protein
MNGEQVSEAQLMLTERGRAIVDWIGRLGAAGAVDVMARFGMGRTATYRRLRTLVANELQGASRLLHGRPALYVATRDGVAFAGLQELDVCRVAWPWPGTRRCPRGRWCSSVIGQLRERTESAVVKDLVVQMRKVADEVR